MNSIIQNKRILCGKDTLPNIWMYIFNKALPTRSNPSLKNDCIVVQAIGSGKSTYFHIPALMLKCNQYGLLIVLTIALSEDRIVKPYELSKLYQRSSKETQKKTITRSFRFDKRKIRKDCSFWLWCLSSFSAAKQILASLTTLKAIFL